MTFHSVRKRRTEELGLNGELTLPSDVFEALLQKLKSQNWNSISCTELVDHLEKQFTEGMSWEKSVWGQN